MNIADVMDEIGTALGEIDGLRVHPFPARKITPPAAVVLLPELITFDATYGRGSDTIQLDIVVFVGAASDRASRDLVAAYADGSGASSVKAALEAHTWTSCDDVHAKSCELGAVRSGDAEYLGAIFTLSITGQGT